MFVARFLAQVDVNLDNLPKVGTNGENVVLNVFEIIFGILAAIAFISVVYGGFKYVISRGEPDRIGKAKDIIMYSLIGLVVAFMAFGIVNLLLRSLG